MTKRKPGRVASRSDLEREVHRQRAENRRAHWRGRRCERCGAARCDPEAPIWFLNAIEAAIRRPFDAIYEDPFDSPVDTAVVRAVLTTVRDIVDEAERRSVAPDQSATPPAGSAWEAVSRREPMSVSVR